MKSKNINGTLNLLFVTLYWVRVRVRDRGSRVRVLELSSVSSIFSVPIIGLPYQISHMQYAVVVDISINQKVTIKVSK